MNFKWHVPNYIAKYVLELTLDHKLSDSTHCTLAIVPLENLLGENDRLVPVTT